MKKLVTIFLFSLVGLHAGAQLSAQWQQVYGGPGVEVGYGVRSCLDQGYIVAGCTSGAGPSDGYVVRTDSLGLVMWAQFYGGINIDVIRSIKILPDSGFIMAGYSNSAGNGGYDGWVLRIDKTGDTLWTRHIGTADWDFFYDVTLMWDGGFVLAGGSYDNGDEDMLFVKLDSIGDMEWIRTYGGTEDDEARGVIQTLDSNLAACGFTYSMGDTLGDSWILMLDDIDGDTVWTRTLGQPNFRDKAYGITNFGLVNSFFVVGETSMNGDPDAYAQGVNYDSTFLFRFVFGGAGSNDYYTSIVTRPNLTFAAIGYTDNPLGGGNGDLYFFHNRTAWFNTGYGTLEPETGNCIDLAHDDGYIVCGSTEGFNSFQPNMYLLKIDTNGLTSSMVAIMEPPAAPVTGVATVYPNPADDQLSVSMNSYTLIEGDLQMIIYDVTGRAVMNVPVSAWQMVNTQSANCQFQTTGLSEGLYHYVIHDDSGDKCNGKFIIAH